MPTTLYDRDGHRCVMFNDLCDTGGDAVQANQFLVVDDSYGAVIDPGGNIAYNELYFAITREFPAHHLSALIASHADPDIIAALDRWATSTQARIYISKLWERFVPHFCKPGKVTERVTGIPDAGMRIPVGRSELLAVPAHFLHAEGNFQFYDPVARILFSGDLGTSLIDGRLAGRPCSRLVELLPSMEPFHRRYMVSNRVMRWWADMVSALPIDMIVPQHGAPLVGPAVSEFIAWARELHCGIDLMTAANYRLPD